MTQRRKNKAPLRLPPHPDFRLAAAIAFGAGLAAGLFQTLSLALLPPQPDSNLDAITIAEPNSQEMID
ncbi:MAG: hypothetical protein ACFB4I_21905 [Cyanophyceae cyanobacterium]